MLGNLRKKYLAQIIAMDIEQDLDRYAGGDKNNITKKAESNLGPQVNFVPQVTTVTGYYIGCGKLNHKRDGWKSNGCHPDCN